MPTLKATSHTRNTQTVSTILGIGHTVVPSVSPSHYLFALHSSVSPSLGQPVSEGEREREQVTGPPHTAHRYCTLHSGDTQCMKQTESPSFIAYVRLLHIA